MTHARTIAAGLTGAQKRKIVAIGNGQPREFALGVTGFALLRFGLAFVNELGARHLTDDGHAVRAILQEQEHA